MRLRYLHLPRCGPLVDVDIVFGQEGMLFGPAEPGKRKGAINFIVGVNGTGKSSLLRAIYQTFRALRAYELPPFPVTLAWDWPDSGRITTAIFHYSSDTDGTVYFARLFDRINDDLPATVWRDRVQEIAASQTSSETMTVDRGADAATSTFLQSYLPRRVVAYTSGSETLWENLEQPGFRRDAESEASISPESQRPPGWTLEREWDEEEPGRIIKAFSSVANAPSDSSRLGQAQETLNRLSETLAPLAEIGRKLASNQALKANRYAEPCFRVRQTDLRMAAVALSLWQTSQELRGKNAETERAAVRDQFLQSTGAGGFGARRVFNHLDWFWPTHLSFCYRDTDARMSKRHYEQLLCLLALADDVVQQPLGRNRAVISLGPVESLDLAERLSKAIAYDIASESLNALSARVSGTFTTGAEAVMRVFSANTNLDTTLVEVFEALRDWQSCGLLEHVTLTIKRLSRVNSADGAADDALVTFDQLSDGEQMLLGRTALLYLLRRQDGALLLLDEPETHFNDVWKREVIDLVDDAMLKDTSAQVLIATHTSIALSDVFSSEIVRLVRRDGHTDALNPAFPTFGADPGRILLHVFGSPEVIGTRAAEFLRDKLKQEWNEGNREELERLVAEIGSGWPRAKLTEILAKLDAASDS